MIWDDPFLDALEPLLARFRDTQERRESFALLRALRLSPDLETLERILQNPASVPRSRLDAEWLRTYSS